MILLDKDLPKEPAEYVESIDEAIEIINRLEYELEHSSIPGIGLHAAQIGINKAVAIVRVKSNDPTNPHCINLVNPKIVEAHDLILYNEGCLSFPNKVVRTIRYKEIVVETLDDYKFYAENVNAKRYRRVPENLPLFTAERRRIGLGEAEPGDEIGQLVCVAIQHEMAHGLAKTFLDFKPEKVGRNDECPNHPGKKNKKCCSIEYYNQNLKLLLNPNYRRG